MKTSFCIFILLACLALHSLALYPTQVGKFDWNKRNIGELDYALIKNYKIAFKSENNVIGSASSSQGTVQWSKKFDDQEVFILPGDNEFLVYDVKASSINFIDYVKGINKLTFRVKHHQPEIRDFDMNVDHEKQLIFIAILSPKELAILQDENVVTTTAPEEGFTFVGVKIDKTHANVLSRSSKKVCLHRFPLTGSASDSAKCVDFAHEFTHSFKDDILVLKAESKSLVFSISRKEAKELKSGDLFPECGAHVSREGSNFVISSFDAKKLSIEKVTILEVLSDNDYAFACGENSKEPKFVALVVSNEKSIKLRSFNLAGKEESNHLLLQKDLDFHLTEVQDLHVSFGDDDVSALIQSSTLQTVFLTKNHKVFWKRDDSLAEIRKIEYFDFTTFASEETNMYFESLENGDSLASIPKNFVLRVTTQIQTLVKEINKYVALATSGKISTLWTATSDEKFDIEYGLNKIIMAVTERNTIFGIESNTGNNRWEKLIPSEWRLESIYKKKRHHGIKDAVLHLVHKHESRTQLMVIDPNDGKLISTEDFDYVPEKIVRAQFGKIDVLILIKNQDEVDIYPRAMRERKDIETLINGIVIYWNKQTEITGFVIQGFKLHPVWNFVFPKEETLFRTANWAYDHEESSFTGIIPEDMKVIYKFVDSNNFAVLTKSTQGGDHLNLYIINGITGRILFTESQQHVDFTHPVNLVFDENAVFVTYFNPKELYYEFWITEFYHTHIESSIRVLVEKYLVSESRETHTPNYNLADTSFTAFTKKYYFSPGVKSLSVVQTKRGITKKNLIVVTNNDQVYSLDRGFVSTRRQYVPEGKTPISDPNSFMSSELPPFHPMLPINTQKYIFYYLTFTGLKSIASVPTQFESSALLAVYGHDLVFSRFAPEKEYDMLNEDFNYLYLLASFAIAAIAVVVVRKFEFRSRIEKIFK